MCEFLPNADIKLEKTFSFVLKLNNLVFFSIFLFEKLNYFFGRVYLLGVLLDGNHLF